MSTAPFTNTNTDTALLSPYRISQLPNAISTITVSNPSATAVKPGGGIFWKSTQFNPFRISPPTHTSTLPLHPHRRVKVEDLVLLVALVLLLLLTLILGTYLIVQRRNKTLDCVDSEKGDSMSTSFSDKRSGGAGAARTASLRIKKIFTAKSNSGASTPTLARVASDNASCHSASDCGSTSSHSSTSSGTSSPGTPTTTTGGIRAEGFEWTWNWDSNWTSSCDVFGEEIAPRFPTFLDTKPEVVEPISPMSSTVELPTLLAREEFTWLKNIMIDESDLPTPALSSAFSDYGSEVDDEEEEDLAYVPSLASHPHPEPMTQQGRRRSHSTPAPLPSIIVSPAAAAEKAEIKRSATYKIRRKPPPAFHIEPTVTQVRPRGAATVRVDRIPSKAGELEEVLFKGLRGVPMPPRRNLQGLLV